jgi:hypothetical protein
MNPSPNILLQVRVECVRSAPASVRRLVLDFRFTRYL